LVVAAELGWPNVTVGKWRTRFLAKRLNGLADEHRPGVLRTVTDDHVEAVVVKTPTEKPADATHWSTRGMAKATGMSQPTVSRIWKAFGLKPWIDDTFKLSTDPLFIDKVRDIVAVPLHADVVVVDEPRTLVRRADQQMVAGRHPPQRRRTRRIHHRMGRHLERQPAPLRVAQDRGRDLRQPRRITAARAYGWREF